MEPIHSTPPKSPFKKPVDWGELKTTALVIKGFFESVDANSIKPGWIFSGSLMSFDRINFRLIPRTWWFIDVINPDAKFRAVEEALKELVDKIKEVERKINLFEPDAENLHKAKSHLNEWIKIRNVMTGISKEGFKTLAKNYLKAGKIKKSNRVTAYRKEVFAHATAVRLKLHEKLKPFLSDLDTALIKLEEYDHPAKDLLKRIPSCRASLRNVFSDSTGLHLPVSLVEDSLFELQFAKVNRLELRVAAEIAKIPAMAEPIYTQGKAAFWEPMRLLFDEDEIIRETGIWGTCERTLEDPNICGLHFCYTKDTKQIAISCGALNNALKAKQLAFAMKEVLRRVPKDNGRWVLLQLNSFRQESNLIRDAHKHIYLNEEMFKSYLEKPDTTILHFNTCVNAATMFAVEDRQALTRINIDSLGFLADFILHDIEDMFKGKPLNDETKKDLDHFKKRSDDLVSLAKKIKELKFQIDQHSQSNLLDRKFSVDDLIAEFEENQICNDESEKIIFDQALIDKSALEKERNKIDQALPKDLEELNEELLKKQDELEKILIKFNEYVQYIYDRLQKEQKENNFEELGKALLIFQVYHEILNLQLKVSGASRTTEIELFLILFRLLKVKPIIFCYSGLDRSGFVRALHDAQIQMERKLFEEEMLKFDEQTKRNIYLARTEACRKLIEMTLKLDGCRDELYSLFDQVVSESKGEIVPFTDLSLPLPWKEDPSINVREALFKKIDEIYPTSQWGKRDILKSGQVYMEMVASQLFSAGLEMTLNSAAITGIKLHHDAGWPKNYFANPHPLTRLPAFCFFGNQVIQLLTYSSWSLKKWYLTLIAQKLLLRLSCKRGN